MEKYYLFTFLLSLMIKKINNGCINIQIEGGCDILFILQELSLQIKNCEECSLCGDDLSCTTCKTGYTLANDKKSCYSEEEVTQHSNDNIQCYQNCLNCSSSSTESNMNCILCKKNFYKKNGTNNCFDLTLLNESYYIKDEIFYPCDENCLTCLDKKNETSNNCLSCDNKRKGLYLLIDKNNCEYSNFSGYYLNKDTKKLHKCYESCKTCNGPYEINSDTKIENHNCIDCADNLYKLPNGANQNNCYSRGKIKDIIILIF